MSLSYGFALRPTDDSADFANALRAITGDGIALQGGRFALTVNGFTAAISSGYALAAGRWVENDESLALTVQPSGNNDDRTDALVVRVDYQARKAALEILLGVDAAAIRASPDLLRNDDEYSILLYLIRVKRGATSLTPDDVTDLREDSGLCGHVVPLSDIAGDVLYIYQFLTSGIDKEVARLIGLSDLVVDKADSAIEELDRAIQQAGGTAEIGELLTSRTPPGPADEWLLCDGSAVPPQYPALYAMLDGTLPRLSTSADRYCTYIYGGTAQEISYYPYAPRGSSGYITPSGETYCVWRQ